MPVPVPLPSGDLKEVLTWIDRVTRYFKPFRPETRKLVVNYKTRRSELHLFLSVPAGLRRHFVDAVIPAFHGFTIDNMVDETYNDVGAAWVLVEGNWKIDATKLPASERFLIKMSGPFPEHLLGQMVRVQPARNKDSTPLVERFWLDSMLRDPEVLEAMWKALDVDEVNVGVRVGIEQILATTAPKSIQKQLEAMRGYVSAGHSRSREELFRAWGALRKSDREAELPVEAIVGLVESLTSGEIVQDFLSVDLPYKLGEVRRDTLIKGIFPERVSVEAKTLLNLKSPTAQGYLHFNKKDYEAKLRAAFGTDEGSS